MSVAIIKKSVGNSGHQLVKILTVCPYVRAIIERYFKPFMVINRYEEGPIRNTIATTKFFRPGHAGLIGPPLVLTIVFCFALIMTHPQQFMASPVDSNNTKQTTLSNHSASKDQLSPAANSKPKQPAPAATPPALAPPAGDTNGGTQNAAPPAVSGVSAPTAPLLQNAGQNQGGLPLDGVINSVIEPVAPTIKNLL